MGVFEFEVDGLAFGVVCVVDGVVEEDVGV